jgi:hypothetical protein
MHWIVLPIMLLGASYTVASVCGTDVGLMATPLMAWALCPYLVGSLTAFLLRRSVPMSVLNLVGCAGVSVLGCLAVRSAFVTHLDPQSAIVLVFLPIWQYAILGVFLILGCILRLFLRRAVPVAGSSADHP